MSKKLRIGLVSKLWEETSANSVGGTGAVVGILADELVRRGHDVTLFATGNSETKAKLVSLREKPWNEDYDENLNQKHIAEAFSSKYSFDVIDCWVEEKACELAAVSKTPTIINITYGDFSPKEKELLVKNRKLNFVSPSKAIQNMLPELDWKGMIHHGIDPSRFPFNENPEDYLLFLGRMSPHKGPDIAIKVAKALGKRLILAGKMVTADKKYLEEKVLPFIDGKQITYVGVADFKTKCELYKNALAFLHPIRFIEAFGMTIIESMVCGTPVIAFDEGAPKELIEQGKTGFVVTTEEEMIDAVKKIGAIKRKDCREHVEKRFNVEQMADGYEELYLKISECTRCS